MKSVIEKQRGYQHHLFATLPACLMMFICQMFRNTDQKSDQTNQKQSQLFTRKWRSMSEIITMTLIVKCEKHRGLCLSDYNLRENTLQQNRAP